MIRTYLKVAYRNLIRNKVFSLINILGLAIGMSACFLIVQYVGFESGYDSFHKDADRIYRVIVTGGTNNTATNHPGAGPALANDFPEVEAFTRAVHQSIFSGSVSSWSYTDEQNNHKAFNEERIYDVDSNFFSVFSFPFIHGDPQNAFPDKSSVVISESTSRKYFGNENPLGKTLISDGGRAFHVTGVFEDMPDNSHLKFDIVVSFFLSDGWGGGWNHSWDWKWPEYYTYVRLASASSRESVEAKLPSFVEKYLGDLMETVAKRYTFELQPLTDIHLTSSGLTKNTEVPGNKNAIYFLSIIAVLILVIAWINYVNLSTSKSIERSREVGVRKVAGASKGQLIRQFLFESAVVNLLAISLSFCIVSVALPFFNQLTGKHMGDWIVDLPLLTKPGFWLAAGAVFIFGSFCAGLYPAFALSSFRIVTVLKGKYFGTRSGVNLRKVLVGSQFAISVALIAGTIVVFRQITFMQSQDLGYAKNQLLVVKSPRVFQFSSDTVFDLSVQAFKTELLRNPGIQNVSATSEIPGKLIPQLNAIRNADEGTQDNTIVYHYYVDQNFIPTYGIELLAGRNFREDDRLEDPETRADLDAQSLGVPIIVNERVVHDLGYQHPDEAINQLVRFGLGPRDWTGEIIGIVANHHQQSLRGSYDPILFFPSPNSIGQYLTFNITVSNAARSIEAIEERYSAIFPGNPFEYFFLDEFFNHQYAADQQFGRVFGLFSTLALIVAGLGLFGLSTFMISQRTKEIAVRKVLGATISSMVALFSKDFVQLIIIANIIALPLVYFGVNQWLDSFAFRVGIGWMMFVFPAAMLLLIALATVGIQTLRTGSDNPIKSLRTE